jgi:phosphomannomutase
MGAIYLFDVDGTLTVAKSKIDPSFATEFFEWMGDKEVYIVSGGSFERIVDQIGCRILNQTEGVFACMGNIFYKNKHTLSTYSEWDKIYENKFTVKKPKLFFSELEREVMKSPYPIKTGQHYEVRTGMVNFSGYTIYDALHRERAQIVDKFKKKYKGLDFVIGGAVSIDIFNTGNDKSQVLNSYFKEQLKDRQVVFVGDRIEYPGNDYSLAEALRGYEKGQAIEVKSWKDTAILLKTIRFEV